MTGSVPAIELADNHTWQQQLDELLRSRRRTHAPVTSSPPEDGACPASPSTPTIGPPAHGTTNLAGVFAARAQLIVHHFGLEEGAEPYLGCSMFTDIYPTSPTHARTPRSCSPHARARADAAQDQGVDREIRC